jgi:hypothetical protein
MLRVIAIGSLLLGLFAIPTKAAVVGGWDVSRGGEYSLSAGANTAPIRAGLSGAFPDTTFTGASTLTSGYLSSLDLLVVTSAFSDSTPITALSPSEQSALMNFVLGGGNALILGERSDFSPLVNPTLVTPFGPNINGTTMLNPTATVTNPASVPFTAGPFGLVTTLSTANPGWFDTLGGAIPVATISPGFTVLAYFPENAIAPGSGRVVISADSDIYFQNSTLIFNTFNYLIQPVPEPSTFVLCGSALAVFGWLARSRKTSKG